MKVRYTSKRDRTIGRQRYASTNAHTHTFAFLWSFLYGFMLHVSYSLHSSAVCVCTISFIWFYLLTYSYSHFLFVYNRPFTKPNTDSFSLSFVPFFSAVAFISFCVFFPCVQKKKTWNNFFRTGRFYYAMLKSGRLVANVNIDSKVCGTSKITYSGDGRFNTWEMRTFLFVYG